MLVFEVCYDDFTPKPFTWLITMIVFIVIHMETAMSKCADFPLKTGKVTEYSPC